MTAKHPDMFDRSLGTIGILALAMIVGAPIFALYKEIATWDPNQDPVLPADCVCPSEPKPECDADIDTTVRNITEARREINMCLSLLKGR